MNQHVYAVAFSFVIHVEDFKEKKIGSGDHDRCQHHQIRNCSNTGNAGTRDIHFTFYKMLFTVDGAAVRLDPVYASELVSS